jgi:hypothetical protein
MRSILVVFLDRGVGEQSAPPNGFHRRCNIHTKTTSIATSVMFVADCVGDQWRGARVPFFTDCVMTPKKEKRKT